MVADADGNGLDFDALLQRIHPAESRVDRLAAETPAAFVAFDLLALGDRSLLDEPMEQRRAALVAGVAANEVVRVTPATTDRAVAEDWFGRFEGAGLDGIVAKPRSRCLRARQAGAGQGQAPADRRVCRRRLPVHKDGNGVGSLLLGLYDADGDLHSVGVAASFSRRSGAPSCSTSSRRGSPTRSTIIRGGSGRNGDGDADGERDAAVGAGGTPARTCRSCRSGWGSSPR